MYLKDSYYEVLHGLNLLVWFIRSSSILFSS